MSKKIFIILGNQLFPVKNLKSFKDDHTFFMCEDYGLCTYEKHHKHKILLFLSAMRSYADDLKTNKYKIVYKKIEDKDFKDSYEDKLKKIISLNKIQEVSFFEIEDKKFEKRIISFMKKLNIKINMISSPMFMCSRTDFKEHIELNKNNLMANFYKYIRKKNNILIESNGQPVGGKWSFDKDNRKKIPKDTKIPLFPKIKETSHTRALKPIIENMFPKHPGSTDNFWLATHVNDVNKLLNFFIKEKSNLFGDYEDAVTQQDNIVFHSALSPYLNLGLVTPDIIIKKILLHHDKNPIKLNSLEGYIRQVLGWREFMRGIYQNYSHDMENKNYFNHTNKMRKSWYEGNTGLPPLDHAIKNADRYGWSHHIERLMILSNIMNLCEIKPTIVYKWFMEMFVDSSDWVMVPNVYGMGLYSDGGIFSTKPYICGSSYFLKMMDFQKGEWCDTMDGLYWRFINKNRKFFLSNARLAMMVRVFDKMKTERKKHILSRAEIFIKENTL